MIRADSDAGAAAGSAVLDLQHLEKYTAGDAALRCELLSLFNEQLSQQISALRGDCRGEDWLIATHTLKGAARAIGAFQIAETAEKLEQLDPAREAQACAKLIDQLALQAKECRAAIADVSQAA